MIVNIVNNSVSLDLSSCLPDSPTYLSALIKANSYSVVCGSNSGKKYYLSSSEWSGEAYSDLR